MAETPPFRALDRPADGMDPDRQEEWERLLEDRELPQRRGQEFPDYPVGWWSNYWMPIIVDDEEVKPPGRDEWHGEWLD